MRAKVVIEREHRFSDVIGGIRMGTPKTRAIGKFTIHTQIMPTRDREKKLFEPEGSPDDPI